MQAVCHKKPAGSDCKARSFYAVGLQQTGENPTTATPPSAVGFSDKLQQIQISCELRP